MATLPPKDDDEQFFDAPDTLEEVPVTLPPPREKEPAAADVSEPTEPVPPQAALQPAAEPAPTDSDTDTIIIAGDSPAESDGISADGVAAGVESKDKWLTLTNLDTGEVMSIDDADAVIPPNPFLAAGAPLEAGSVAVPLTAGSLPVPAALTPVSEPTTPPSGMRRLLDEIARLIGRGKKGVPSPMSTMERKPAGWVPVETHDKPRQELTELCLVQRIPAHREAIWVVKFSKCGRYLATGGKDMVLRVWRVAGTDNAELSLSPTPSGQSPRTPYDADGTPFPGVGSGSVSGSEGASAAAAAGAAGSDLGVLFDSVPLREYSGHQHGIFSIAWSPSKFILSASMDQTVRLWHLSQPECLCVFPHVDFVTAVDFHPLNERFFLSGSMDEKIRIWAIQENKVVHWAKARGIVTSATFTRDGAMVMCGLNNGLLCFYQTDGLRFVTQIQVRSARGRNSTGRKITGLQLTPDGEHVLVSSVDSRIRMYSLTNYSQVCKYSGLVNTTTHIRASMSDGGDYIISASEDQRVLVWNRSGSDGSDQRPRFRSVRSDSYEAFKVGPAAPTAAVFVPPAVCSLYTSTQMQRIAAALTTPPGALSAPPTATSTTTVFSYQPQSQSQPATAAASAPVSPRTQSTAAAVAAKSGADTESDNIGSGSDSTGARPPLPSPGPSPRSASRSVLSAPPSVAAGPVTRESLVGAMVVVTDNEGAVLVFRNTGYPRVES